jgi:hypothetical protein
MEVKKNLPNYCTDFINYNNSDLFEIKKNILAPNSDLYLLVDYNSDECHIRVMSDSKDSIIKLKYEDETNNISNCIVISSTLLLLGLLSGIIVNSK